MFKFFRKKSNDVDKQQESALKQAQVDVSDSVTVDQNENIETTDDGFVEVDVNNALDSQNIAVEDALDNAFDHIAALDDIDEDYKDLNVVTREEVIVSEPEEADLKETKQDEPKQEETKQSKSSWLSRLRKGLSRTGENIGSIFTGGAKLDEDLYEELETALIMADSGLEATESMLSQLRKQVKKDRLTDASQAKQALKVILTKHLEQLEKPFEVGRIKPLVIMIAGVNGAGKTTSIGKMAYTLQANNASVLLAAGDTFRAAAREQLLEWGSRNNVTVIAQEGSDPAAVAFDAVNAGKARDTDVVMVDTAGRLPTQLNLMQELQKIKRVINKADNTAPHEVLLVVDGNTGQNALNQIKAFDASIGLTGLIVTKLDGTAKGGVLAAVAAGSQGVRPIPVYWIGVGEGMHDLQPFVAKDFAEALIGD